jgi:hypothetical protein
MLKTILFAASLAAAGAAFADQSQVTVDNLNQSQTGSRNKQSLEMGVVDMDTPLGTSRTIVNARDIRQTQSGSRNTQSMVIGKVDKNLGSHTVQVNARNVVQSQSGSRNEQKLKIGVIE